MRKVFLVLCACALSASAMADDIAWRNVNVKGADAGVSLNGNVTNNVDVSNATNVTVKIVDPGGIPAEVDNATHSLQFVDYEHHEVHSGSHYEASFVDGDLDTDETTGVYIVVADSTKWPHMLFNASTTAAADGFICEGVALSATGTLLAAVNNNRNSTNTALTTKPTHIPRTCI